MKYLMMLLGLMVICEITPAKAESCKRIMENAGYTKEEFKMLDDHTIVILPNFSGGVEEFERRDMKGLKAPHCDVISLTNWLSIGEEITVEVNTISAYNLHNYGTLKAREIIVPPKKEDIKRLGFRRRRKSEEWMHRLDCGLSNRCGHGAGYIEADYIYVNCEKTDTDISGGIYNSGTIKAREVHGRCASHVEEFSCDGINNSGILPNNSLFKCKPAIIKADIVTGVGYDTGVSNSTYSEIVAKTVKGTGYAPKDETAFSDGNGIHNWGTITAQNVECCSVHGSECYKDHARQDEKEYTGKVSTTVHQRCPNEVPKQASKSRRAPENVSLITLDNKLIEFHDVRTPAKGK